MKARMSPKRRRLWLLLGSLGALGAAVALMLTVLNDNLVFFYSPTQVILGTFEGRKFTGRPIRLGGLVEQGSIKKNGQELQFTVTDLKHQIPVVYRGIVPDLFREGQGVIAQGMWGEDGIFTAREVLAKHDENYMPPEVAKALKEAGRWKEGGK
jgi:cytochrome c-type biogenesis protein CcmE